jgi:hypothetical protein
MSFFVYSYLPHSVFLEKTDEGFIVRFCNNWDVPMLSPPEGAEVSGGLALHEIITDIAHSISDDGKVFYLYGSNLDKLDKKSWDAYMLRLEALALVSSERLDTQTRLKKIIAQLKDAA